jgi:hypothetical protein
MRLSEDFRICHLRERLDQGALTDRSVVFPTCPGVNGNSERRKPTLRSTVGPRSRRPDCTRSVATWPPEAEPDDDAGNIASRIRLSIGQPHSVFWRRRVRDPEEFCQTAHYRADPAAQATGEGKET